ncbi:MAG TPA: hypothetical protein VF157_10315, partial [Chloroflexota bacterium]
MARLRKLALQLACGARTAPAVWQRVLLLAAGLAILLVPADSGSLLPGVPVDIRLGVPIAIAIGFAAVCGRPSNRAVWAIAGLAALKLLLLPLTIQHGLIGSYYGAADLSGPVQQVRLDHNIDFTDRFPDLSFFNDPQFTWPAAHPADLNQVPFSVRWQGYIVGGPLSVESDQHADIQGSTIVYSKGWGRPRLRLVGAQALYPEGYPEWRIATGNIVKFAQDALDVVFLGLLLLLLPAVRFRLAGLTFLASAVQSYAQAWASVGKFAMLTRGDDWLTYEGQARDVLAHGWLMNGGAPLFQGRPFYYQSFYSYFLALAHLLTGPDFGGIIFFHSLFLGVTAVCILLIGLELFGWRAGIIGLLLFVWLVQAEFRGFTDLLLSENLVYPLIAGAICLFIRQLRTKSKLELALSALLLGFAIDTRASILPFAALPLLALLRDLRWKGALGFAGMCAAGLSVVGLRNELVSGKFAVLPTSGGVNLALAHSLPADVAGQAVGGSLLPALAYFAQHPLPLMRDMIGTAVVITGFPASLSALGHALATSPKAIAGPVLFALWILAPASILVLRTQAVRSGPLLLYAFILLQFGTLLAFGLLSYGLRLALLAYVFLPSLAAVTLCFLFRRGPWLGLAVAGLCVLTSWPTAWPAPRISLPPGPPLARINPEVELAAADYPAEVHPGQTIDLRLTWHVLHDTFGSYQVLIHGVVQSTNQDTFVADDETFAL